MRYLLTILILLAPVAAGAEDECSPKHYRCAPGVCCPK